MQNKRIYAAAFCGKEQDKENAAFPTGVYKDVHEQGKRKFDAVRCCWFDKPKSCDQTAQIRARQEERGFPDGSVQGRTRARKNASSTKYCEVYPSPYFLSDFIISFNSAIKDDKSLKERYTDA